VNGVEKCSLIFFTKTKTLVQGPPMERRREGFARVPLEQLPGLRRVGENEIVLGPIQGVYSPLAVGAGGLWEYRRWVEEGLMGEIKDPFAAVKWQQVLGGEGFWQTQGSLASERPAAQELRTEEKLVSCGSRAGAKAGE
jgi:hypothetical protein